MPKQHDVQVKATHLVLKKSSAPADSALDIFLPPGDGDDRDDDDDA